MSEWQDISTAPKVPEGGREWAAPRILLLSNNRTRVDIGKWYPPGPSRRGNGWKDDHFRNVFAPTHWMPIPEPPQ